MGNKDLVPWFVLMSFYSWKKSFMVHMYESIKPSSPKEALKIWEIAPKAGKLWQKIF